MTKDALSALLDGECSARDLDQVLAEFERSPGLKAEYSRMLMAREARTVRIRRPDPRFADRILAELGKPDAGRGNVISFAERIAPMWKPALGLAMAAGFGALAVLVLQTQPGADLQAPATVATASATTGAREVAEQNWNQLNPADAEQLNSYLIAYSQSRAQQGMGGTLGYARYAAYTDENRPQRLQGPRAMTAESRR